VNVFYLKVGKVTAVKYNPPTPVALPICPGYFGSGKSTINKSRVIQMGIVEDSIREITPLKS
jgi:hypothetical protein